MKNDFLLMIMRRMIKEYKIFSITKKIKKYIALFAVSIESLKNLKYHTFQKEHKFFLLYAASAGMNMKNYLKKKNQLRH